MKPRTRVCIVQQCVGSGDAKLMGQGVNRGVADIAVWVVEQRLQSRQSVVTTTALQQSSNAGTNLRVRRRRQADELVSG
jgi:hypothetical protein